MSATDREPGHVRATVLHVRDALAQAPKIRIIINNGSRALFAPMLDFYGIADRVEMVGDPQVPIGDAVVDTDGILAWAASLAELGDERPAAPAEVGA